MSHKRKQNPQPSTKDQRIAELELELVRERANVQRLQVNNFETAETFGALAGGREELKRAGKRQAAPFARRKLVEHPKRPGRKPGKGSFPGESSLCTGRSIKRKKARLDGCPQCGGRLRDIHQHEQYMTDIPKTIRLVTTRYVTYSGYCADCRKRVRSWHRNRPRKPPERPG